MYRGDDSYLLLGSAGLLDDKFGDVGGLGVSHGLVSVLAGSPGLCSLTDDHRSTTIRLRLSRGEARRRLRAESGRGAVTRLGPLAGRAGGGSETQAGTGRERRSAWTEILRQLQQLAAPARLPPAHTGEFA